MSKERLEEIETKYSTLTVSSEKNSTEYTEVDVEDLVFLIQNGFKQAERVQELEELLIQEKYDKNLFNARTEEWIKMKQQNKRYREALEEVLKTGDYEDMQDYIDRIVTKACQALEGEE